LSDPAGSERAAWAISAAGGEPWRVVAANSVSLSPDGRWVLYVEEGQVYRAAVNPGADGSAEAGGAARLFRAFGSVSDPVWSPDGSKIAFVSERGTHSFVGVYDVGARRVTYMAPSVDRDISPAWSPDGERLAFVRRPGQPFGAVAKRPDTLPPERVPPGFLEARFSGGHSLELWVAHAATGEAERLWQNRRGDARFVQLNDLTWAGENLVFWSEPQNWRRYFSISAVEPRAEPVALTHAEGLPEQIAYSPDGLHLYFATNHADIDRRHIWRVPTRGGEPVQLTRGQGIETFPAVLGSGDQLALLSADARQPQSVAVVSADGGEPHMLKETPERYPAALHVEPENVFITAPDGLEFHNQLFLPPDLQSGERRPALIFIHGGPRRQMLLGYNYGHFYHMAYAVNQYFANKGYVVLSVNFRGGIGYGRKFREAPRMGRHGMEEYQDILAAGRYLESREDVDPGRIALWGLSYGGILTAQGLARNSDLFVAGADIAGVHFWGDTLDPTATTYTSSAVSHIDRWTSPVLLVHGDDDRNVAFSQTVGLVQLLRTHDVPYELIVFPDEVHSFLVHEHWLKTFRAMDDFFDRTVIQREAVQVDADGSE
jgi:dipeptidyl-peptidase 4